jgi:ActR/RegA family two-component response regulator
VTAVSERIADVTSALDSYGLLLVEDDAETLDTYARSLTRQGYRVCRSTSGEEA